MIDQFKNHAPGLESPPQGGFDITPSDTADLSQALRGINVSASGTVRVSTVDGADLTLTVAAGIIFPIRATRVWATGTSANGIVGLY